MSLGPRYSVFPSGLPKAPADLSASADHNAHAADNTEPVIEWNKAQAFSVKFSDDFIVHGLSRNEPDNDITKELTVIQIRDKADPNSEHNPTVILFYDRNEKKWSSASTIDGVAYTHTQGDGPIRPAIAAKFIDKALQALDVIERDEQNKHDPKNVVAGAAEEPEGTMARARRPDHYAALKAYKELADMAAAQGPDMKQPVAAAQHAHKNFHADHSRSGMHLSTPV
jgi:hypothetical protein